MGKLTDERLREIYDRYPSTTSAVGSDIHALLREIVLMQSDAALGAFVRKRQPGLAAQYEQMMAEEV